MSEPDDTSRVLYHLGEQNAFALLSPMAATLQTLEARTAHYLAHLRLSDVDRRALREAEAELRAAEAALRRLAEESRSPSEEEAR